MKSRLPALALCALCAQLLATPVMAAGCFNSKDSVQRGITQTILSVCKQEHRLYLDWNKVHAKTLQVGIPNLSVDCFNSCRSAETPDQCAARYNSETVAQWLAKNRHIMPQICGNESLR